MVLIMDAQVGVSLMEGRGVAIITYGPVMLPCAVRAVKKLRSEDGLSVKVVNLPWLN
jgi:transketolase